MCLAFRPQGELHLMRMTTVVVAGLLMAAPVAAQPWEEYVNTDDGFKVNFPGQPTVTEMTWQSQLDYRLPGREYTVERGRERYSVTVVDYSGLEQQGVERSATCPPGNAQCRSGAGPVLGPGYWKHDERGAIVYATFNCPWGICFRNIRHGYIDSIDKTLEYSTRMIWS